MKIAYLSLTGNVRSFVEEIGMESVEIDYFNPFTEMDDNYILIMPSYDDEITDIISDFIDHKENLKYLIGVVGSGNINFGKDGYCFNAVEISKKYNKPLIFRFEFTGTNKDVTDFKEEVQKIEITRTTKQS